MEQFAMLALRNRGDLDWRNPAVTAFGGEKELQQFLKDAPEHLLPPSMFEPPIIMVEEFPVAGDSADLVGFDAAGNILIVECKLRSGSRIPREAFGQVLAYAAGIAEMSFNEFDRTFKVKTGKTITQSLLGAGLESIDEESVRTSISRNLEVGQMHLILAVDSMTEEFKRIVRFTVQHLSSELKLCALELRLMRDGQSEILVSEVYPELVVDEPSPPPPSVWDETTFIKGLQQSGICSDEGANAVKEFLEEMKRRSAVVVPGRGPREPRILLKVHSAYRRDRVTVVSVRGGNGFPVRLETYIGPLHSAGVPDPVLDRFIERLRQVPDQSLQQKLARPRDKVFSSYPSILVDKTLTDQHARTMIIEALDELIREIKERNESVPGEQREITEPTL